MQTDLAHSILKRPRRNRRTSAIRALVQETRLHPSNFVAPLFVCEGENVTQNIDSMPGVSRLSVDLILKEVADLQTWGVRALDLFGYLPREKRNRSGSEALNENNLVNTAIRVIKNEFPEVCVMVDIALDPYTDHGHDGLINDAGEVLNDETLQVLGQMSVLAAAAGADIVAPSDMMDGRVLHIREALDSAELSHVGILAYAAKYASAFYGPFRDALQSAPKFGDKKGYQLNPANWREALMECALDEWEGADMLLIKPALPYLDIIAKIREQTTLPIGAYHVSGEYAMIMAAAQLGWLDGERAMMESLLSIKRAGADFIFTYAAKWAARFLNAEC